VDLCVVASAASAFGTISWSEKASRLAEIIGPEFGAVIKKCAENKTQLLLFRHGPSWVNSFSVRLVVMSRIRHVLQDMCYMQT
jgi:hypothetical protein